MLPFLIAGAAIAAGVSFFSGSDDSGGSSSNAYEQEERLRAARKREKSERIEQDIESYLQEQKQMLQRKYQVEIRIDAQGNVQTLTESKILSNVARLEHEAQELESLIRLIKEDKS
ncbi:MAG: hypothetical protein Q9N02_08130 [Ghiorsea sp.]|nr:hypothetical protein [Ghiorsea sp.]